MTAEKILIVDDEPTIQSSLEMILEEEGYRVSISGTGRDALDKVGKESFDLILLDYKLPDIDGLEVAQTIRRAHPDILVVFMTGYASLETALTVMKMGAVDFLQKPINHESLLSAVKRSLQTKKLLSQGVHNLKTPNILIVDDENVIRSALEQIFRTEGYRCKSCSSGAEAMKMVEEDLFHLMIVDLKLSDMDGTEVISSIRKYHPDIMAIVITGHPSVESAVNAIKSSAFDYIVKPLSTEDILYRVKMGWERHRQSILVKQLLQNLRVTNLELEKSNARLTALSITDDLTSLYNHRHSINVLSLEYKKAERHSLPLCLMLLDLDYFKFVNDTYGHLSGDKILAEVAEVLKSSVRDTDVVGRFGGEEFCIILPNTDVNGSLTVAEKIRQTVAGRKFVPLKNMYCNITTSIGIGAFPSDTVCSVEDLIWQADQALHEAKVTGRNKVVCWRDSAKELREETLNPGTARDSTVEYLRRASHTAKMLRDNCIQSVQAMVLALEAKDGYTATHGCVVSHYCVMLARLLKLPEGEIEILKTAALLHDIGKINIPETILMKEEKLTEGERAVIRRHADVGARILRPLSFLNKETEIVLSHQERWDGTGYPRGLKGDEIPLGARILAVCDAFEAMTAKRPYRKKPLGVKEATGMLKKEAGRQFDPHLVDMFVSNIKEILEAKRELYIRELGKTVVLPSHDNGTGG